MNAMSLALDLTQVIAQEANGPIGFRSVNDQHVTILVGIIDEGQSFNDNPCQTIEQERRRQSITSFGTQGVNLLFRNFLSMQGHGEVCNGRAHSFNRYGLDSVSRNVQDLEEEERQNKSFL